MILTAFVYVFIGMFAGLTVGITDDINHMPHNVLTAKIVTRWALWPLFLTYGVLWLLWHSYKLPALAVRGVKFLSSGYRDDWVAKHPRKPALPSMRVIKELEP